MIDISLNWLDKIIESIDFEKLPHGMIINGPDGIGKEFLSREIASRLLLNKTTKTLDKELFNSNNHPDFFILDKDKILINHITLREDKWDDELGQRNDKIVDIMNKLGVTINFITDGDIAGVLSVIGEKPKNDIYYSTGGGPEGVLAASALSCFGGQMQGRLVLNEEEKIRAKKLGISDFKKKYNIEDMVKGDVIFCATGVTDGDLTKGVKDLGNEFEVTTFALHKSKKINKIIRNIYNK